MLSITVIGCILVLGNALRSSLTDSSIVSRGRCQIRSQGHVIGWGNSIVQMDHRCAIPLFAGLSSDEFADKNTKLDVADVTQVPSRRLFERVQRGLAKLTEIVPKPILITVVAVASGLLFFELSKTLMLLALPVIVVLGGVQSLKEGLEVAVNGPRVYDTEMIESFVSDGSGIDTGSNRSQSEEGAWDNKQYGSAPNSMEELEKQSRERSGRLAAIQRRISETSGDLRNAINSASSLRTKISSYVDKIDRAGVVSSNIVEITADARVDR